MIHVIFVIITTSSDFRIHRHGGLFVDVREGAETGRQLTTRNPADRVGADAFVAELQAAAKNSGKVIRFEIIDRT